MVRLRAPNERDRLISLVRYGKVTPEQAEAEAATRGWPPFAREVGGSFDPTQESWWSIVMAVAWIAWRDLKLTREQSTEYRSECTRWSFREWKQPIRKGTEFAPRKGWFLETWSEPTVLRLALLDRALETDGEPPSHRQMSIRDAERILWQALSDGRIVAEGCNENGKLGDIPQGEWTYLKLFEEGKREFLKYDALDRRQPYTPVKLKRDDLFRIWPAPRESQPLPDTEIDSNMIAPLSEPGRAGYVPLCAALHWIATACGTRTVMLEDGKAWQASVLKLWPLICSGEIELNGLPFSGGVTERIPGHTLPLIKVLAPLHSDLGDILLSAPSYIACIPFIDFEHWTRDFNDKLYISGNRHPAWSHLQVLKSQILARWPRPSPKANAETNCFRWLCELMEQSPSQRRHSRSTLLAEAKKKYGVGRNQFNRAWELAITQTGARVWSNPGRSRKSNHSSN